MSKLKSYLPMIKYLTENSYGIVEIVHAIDFGNGWYKPLHELNRKAHILDNDFITMALIKLDKSEFESCDKRFAVSELSEIQREVLRIFIGRNKLCYY